MSIPEQVSVDGSLSNGLMVTPGRYGNEATLTTPDKTRGEASSPPATATLVRTPSTHICMDFTEAIRHESLPLRPCGHCGLEYGTSSIVFHERSCNFKGSSKTKQRKEFPTSRRQIKLPKVGKTTSILAETLTAGKSAEVTAIGSLATLSPLQDANVPSVRVFGSLCEYCGERFGRHSLQLHLRKCRHRNGRPNAKHQQQQDQQRSSSGTCSRALAEDVLGRQSVDAGDSHSVQHLIFNPPRVHPRSSLKHSTRPRTRSLEHSVLVEKGYSLPIIDCNSTQTKVLCNSCGELIVSEKMALHLKFCKSPPRTVAKGDIVFPTLRPATGCKVAERSDTKKMVGKRPPTAVCYICGREYGTKSISIHEPQCLKRFELENKKLPVSERKPMPKKPINHAALVIPIALPELEKAASHTRTGGVYRNEILQDAVDQYFQYCYSEWEKDLILCKSCRRKFAPERHVKHAHRCKAKPLGLPNAGQGQN